MHYIASSLLSSLGWGIAPLFDRYSSQYINGLTLASTRGITMGICAIIIFIGLKLKQKNNLYDGYKKAGNKLLLFLFLSPVIGFCLGHLGFYTAISKAPSSISQIVLLSHCVPLIIVTILSTCFYKDKINWQMMVGLILSITGMYITIKFDPNHH